MAMNPRLLVPRATFDPRRLPGLAAWHDAAAADTVTLDSGRVSAWADKSGNGRTMSNSTSGSTQPDYITAGQNGRNLIRFSAASTQRLTAAATSTYNFLHDGTPTTVLMAVKTGDSSNPNTVFGLLGSSAGSSLNIGAQVFYDDRTALNSNLNDAFNCSVIRGVDGSFVATTSNIADYKDVFLPNISSVITVTLDVANATAAERLGFAQNNATLVKANTETAAASTSNATHALQYGCAGNNLGPFTGDFCEVLMYTRLLSDAELSAARQYLYAKWAITP
jgi:hypothetical protein